MMLTECSWAVLLILIAGTWSLTTAQPCDLRYGPTAGGFRGDESKIGRATTANDSDCVLYFLEQGLSPNQPNKDQNTPLTQAASLGYLDILKLLMSHGGYPNDKNTIRDQPMIAAACKGKADIVQYLLDAGASVDIVNQKMLKPINKLCCCLSDKDDCPSLRLQELLGKTKSFYVYFNHDFPSDDGILNDGRKNMTANNRECKDLCAHTSGCKAWTRTKRTIMGGSQAGECRLRNYRPAAVKCDHCDSGVMSCDVYDNSDYTTLDDLIGRGKISAMTESNEDCCALCYGISNCRSWTRFENDTKHHRTGECWLRSGYSHGHKNEATASGRVKMNEG